MRILKTLAATTATLAAGVAFAATAQAAPAPTPAPTTPAAHATTVGAPQYSTPFYLTNNTEYQLSYVSQSGGDNPAAPSTIAAFGTTRIGNDVFWFAKNNVVTQVYRVLGTPYLVQIKTNPAAGTYPAASRCEVTDGNGHEVAPKDFNCVGDGDMLFIGKPVSFDIRPNHNPDPQGQDFFHFATGAANGPGDPGNLRDQGGFVGTYDGTTFHDSIMELTSVEGANQSFAVLESMYDQAKGTINGGVLSYSSLGSHLQLLGGHDIVYSGPRDNS